MICRECGRQIPDEHIACPVCFAQTAERAMQTYQRDALDRLVRTSANFGVRAVDGNRHVQLLGYPQTSFCGLPLSPRARFSLFNFTTQNANTLCEKCRARIEEIAGRDIFVREVAPRGV